MQLKKTLKRQNVKMLQTSWRLCGGGWRTCLARWTLSRSKLQPWGKRARSFGTNTTTWMLIREVGTSEWTGYLRRWGRILKSRLAKSPAWPNHIANQLAFMVDTAHGVGPHSGHKRSSHRIIVCFLSWSHWDMIWKDARTSELLKERLEATAGKGEERGKESWLQRSARIYQR